jgi:nascent polypeptide-associated complex subunit beta|tara:strand:+ start:555 stop:728 length:174 start_codon:yes stop_codon:yes gene_type:complete
MNQLGPDNINHLKQIADNMSVDSNATDSPDVRASRDANDDDDDVPDLVSNFEDVSKM